MSIRNYLTGHIAGIAMLMPMTLIHAEPVDPALSECVACHRVAQPLADTMTLDERLNRIGPSLYYAGNKYQQNWLEQWLQNPTRIYPAGVYFGKFVEVTDEGDIVREKDLPQHSRLNKQQAQAVAAALAKLQPKSNLLADTTGYEVKKISLRSGMMNFRKFKGCSSCHLDEVGESGLSGPELITAYQRLQLAYIISYIKDPTAWEPKSLMPNQHLKDKVITKLVAYLKAIAEERQ
jgi:mono/diheme cytochrome c family protein